MKNIIIWLNIGVLLLIFTMIIAESTISIISGADGIIDILIPAVFGLGMLYVFFVAIINIYWLWKKCPKDLNA